MAEKGVREGKDKFDYPCHIYEHSKNIRRSFTCTLQVKIINEAIIANKIHLHLLVSLMEQRLILSS